MIWYWQIRRTVRVCLKYSKIHLLKPQNDLSKLNQWYLWGTDFEIFKRENPLPLDVLLGD